MNLGRLYSRYKDDLQIKHKFDYMHAVDNKVSNSVNWLDDAEEYHLQGIEIIENLVKENSKRYNNLLVSSYICLGDFYKKQEQMRKKEEYYIKGIKTIEKVARSNLEKYYEYLNEACLIVCRFYEQQEKKKKQMSVSLSACQL